MHRRRLLHGSLPFLPALAGCLTTFGGTGGASGNGGRYELDSPTVTTERVAPDHRYTVQAQAFYQSVDVDHAVIAYEELSDPIRSVVDAVLDDGSYAADDLPEGTRSALESHDFVDCTDRGTGYDYVGFEVLEVDLEEPPRLAVEAQVLDPVAEPGDPAVIELSARNDGDRPLAWYTGAPAPFGILRTDAELVLWTDAYEESSHVHVRGGRIRGVNDIAVGTQLDPGETVAERYELQVDRDGFGPGSDALTDELATEFDGGRESVSITVGWTVKELEDG